MQTETIIPLPEFDEIPAVPLADAVASPQETDVDQTLAVIVALTSAAIGVTGTLLFFAQPLGINAFLFVGIALLAAFGVLVYAKRPIMRHHALFVVPAVLFAFLLSVRVTPQVVVFNGAAVISSLLIVAHFTSTKRFLGGHWLTPLQYTLESVTVGWIETLQAIIPASTQIIGQADFSSQRLSNVRSVLRGVVLALPILALFTVLLGSADVVFANTIERALMLVIPNNVGSLIVQLIMIGIFGFLFLVGCWTMITDRSEPLAEAALSDLRRTFRLNIIEASTVLISVNALFAVFVVIQARYFFGGEANINEQGYTYAEYARRGFYEMLAVSCMTMLLLVTFENLTQRKREAENVFRTLVVLMVALTFVILIAAYRRLSLYEDAYGFTRIRVMSGTFMGWLAALLIVLLVALLMHRPQLFWIGCILAAFGFILTLNVINLDGYIADHNIKRFDETGKLDVSYLLSLSDDAMPRVSDLLNNPTLEASDRNQLVRGLGMRLALLDRNRDNRDLFGFHFGQNRVWQVLSQYRDELNPDQYRDYLSNRS